MVKDNNPRSRVLARSASEIRNYRRWMNFLKAVVGVLIVATAITYVASALYSRTGSFTVGINKYELERYGLSLCETRDFALPVAQLNAKANDRVTNMSGADLPPNIDQIDGSHNGKDYLAYTFYLKNTGTMTLSYSMTVNVLNVKNDIDEAVRIRIWMDGEPVTYAKIAKDGSGLEVLSDEPFLSETVVTRRQYSLFMPGQVAKYTFAIWIEGDDPDCRDDLIGGEIKVSATFSVISANGEDVTEQAS